MLKVLKIKNNIKKNTQVIDENYINQFAPSFDCDLYESKYEVYDLCRLILKSVALGDSAGAPLEGRKNVEVPQNFLYLNNSNITDDTTLTVATMHAIMQLKEFPDFIKYYALYGKNYPDMGYGGSFYSWIKLKKKENGIWERTIRQILCIWYLPVIREPQRQLLQNCLVKLLRKRKS